MGAVDRKGVASYGHQLSGETKNGTDKSRKDNASARLGIREIREWISGLDSAEELAASYAKEGGPAYEQANSLIRWQNTKSATSGFITGLGGLITLPVALPANITSVLFVQIRMIAAIAQLGGYDVKDDKVKTLVFACLTANSAKEVL